MSQEETYGRSAVIFYVVVSPCVRRDVNDKDDDRGFDDDYFVCMCVLVVCMYIYILVSG